MWYSASMSTAMRQPMTVEAFLEWEEGQLTRYEFDGFRAYAMTGVRLTIPVCSVT